MKATIAGIQVEGTPEEIIKFRELLSKSDVKFTGGVISERGNDNVDIEKIAKELNKQITNGLKRDSFTTKEFM